MKSILLIALIFNMVGCKKVIEDHELSFASNQVISTTTISKSYGLPFSGNFPIDIKDKNYGEINLYPKTANDDFQVEVIADFTTFDGDVWDGFDPIESLPGNNRFPTWMQTTSLLKINIPTFNENISIDLLFSKSDKFYFGLTLGIKKINDKYPEGLKASQEIARKSSETPWAEVFIHGPTYDENGDVIENAGITIVSSFSKSKISL